MERKAGSVSTLAFRLAGLVTVLCLALGHDLPSFIHMNARKVKDQFSEIIHVWVL